MTPTEWREAVGQRIEARRTELRLSVRGAAGRANISEGQWRQIESGRRTIAKGIIRTVNPRPDTRAAVCTVLGWAPSSIDLLVAGREPLERLPSDERIAAARQRLDALAMNAELADLKERVSRLEVLLGVAAQRIHDLTTETLELDDDEQQLPDANDADR